MKKQDSVSILMKCIKQLEGMTEEQFEKVKRERGLDRNLYDLSQYIDDSVDILSGKKEIEKKKSSAVKQVIVMRKDLNMTKGKYVAQGSHASLGVILKMMKGDVSPYNFKPKIIDGKYVLTLEVEVGSDLDQWLRGIFTKVCLYVNSETELTEIYKKAMELGLPIVLIEDAGLTMFNGVRTKTCLAIGPANAEKIDEITGNLKLL